MLQVEAIIRPLLILCSHLRLVLLLDRALELAIPQASRKMWDEPRLRFQVAVDKCHVTLRRTCQQRLHR